MYLEYVYKDNISYNTLIDVIPTPPRMQLSMLQADAQYPGCYAMSRDPVDVKVLSDNQRDTQRLPTVLFLIL